MEREEIDTKDQFCRIKFQTRALVIHITVIRIQRKEINDKNVIDLLKKNI